MKKLLKKQIPAGILAALLLCSGCAKEEAVQQSPAPTVETRRIHMPEGLPVFVSGESACTDPERQYVLPDGGLYAWVPESSTESTETGDRWQLTEEYLPSDWHTEVLRTGEQVRSHKDQAGDGAVQFLITTDIHLEPSGVNEGRVKNIGRASAGVMELAQIPLMLNLGDSCTQSSQYSTADIADNFANVLELMRPIPDENILLTVGNHDGATGQKEENGEILHYRYQLSNIQRAELFFDWQRGNDLKQFGPGGTCFYMDDCVSKTRYIMLNSFWSQWEGGSDGFTRDIQNSFFHNPLFGQAQLTWFAEKALNMPAGYSAVIGTHCPTAPLDCSLFWGIVEAYNLRLPYTGAYTGEMVWQSSEISVDYTNAQGELIAVFAGHNHVDAVVQEGWPIPLIRVTTAGGDVRDNPAPQRTEGTATETAIEVVTIDRNNRTIYLTRLGAGEDRIVQY